eukprot:763521-Hanusia_phi.AAC.6
MEEERERNRNQKEISERVKRKDDGARRMQGKMVTLDITGKTFRQAYCEHFNIPYEGEEGEGDGDKTPVLLADLDHEGDVMSR